jgi:DNA primase
MNYLKTNVKLDQEKFSNTLSSELTKSFDTCFLFPLPKLEEEQYKDELKKVIKELLTLFIKERVNVLTAEIRTKEKDKQANTEELKEELSKLISLLPKD